MALARINPTIFRAALTNRLPPGRRAIGLLWKFGRRRAPVGPAWRQPNPFSDHAGQSRRSPECFTSSLLRRSTESSVQAVD
jgi:hypothetical protein